MFCLNKLRTTHVQLIYAKRMLFLSPPICIDLQQFATITWSLRNYKAPLNHIRISWKLSSSSNFFTRDKKIPFFFYLPYNQARRISTYLWESITRDSDDVEGFKNSAIKNQPQPLFNALNVPVFSIINKADVCANTSAISNMWRQWGPTKEKYAEVQCGCTSFVAYRYVVWKSRHEWTQRMKNNAMHMR